MAELNKDRVKKVYIYNKNDELITATTVISYPKSLFKAAGKVAVCIKSTELRHVKKNDNVKLVFEYTGGTRHQTIVRVEGASATHIDVHVGNVTELEERRSSFKINIREKVVVYRSKKADADSFDGTILNINIGGVLLKTELMFNPGDTFYLSMLDGELELCTKVLRKQTDSNGKLIGYGCMFQDVTDSEEEMITKFIYDCQKAELERRRRMDDEYAATAM